MRARILLAVLLLTGCEPRLPGAMSGVRVTVRGAGVDAGVVFVRFEPDESMPTSWAIDASDGLPASRTLWTRRSGIMTIVAAAYDCPSSCRDVDPWSSRPLAVGSASVEMRLQRTVSATIHLESSVCGNGTVEAGEACDGDHGCEDDCTMPLVEQGTYPGGPDDGIEVVPTEEGFAVAWIDGSCGADDCSCLSWMAWAPGGIEEGSHDAGATTCSLDDDLGSTLGWIDVSDPTPAIVALTSWPPAVPVALGTTDEGVLGTPAVHGPAGDLQAIGLAVEPELGELELRWAETGPTIGSTGAGPLYDGQRVGMTSLAVTGAGLGALWAVLGPDPGVYLRRWSVDSSSGPVPLETAPVLLDSILVTTETLLLQSPESGRLGILTMTGAGLEVRTFPFSGEVPDEPEILVTGVAGGSIEDVASDEEHGILVLLVDPVSGTPDCLTRLLVLDPAWSWRPVEVASWGGSGGLGCQARMAMLPGDRFAIAWRTPATTADQVLVQWSIGSLELGF